jgi:tRNA G46 methylase TrmB
MAEAGAEPHLPEDGRVVAFTPQSTSATVVATGAPLAVDVGFGRGRTLYALAQGTWDGAFEGSWTIENLQG